MTPIFCKRFFVPKSMSASFENHQAPHLHLGSGMQAIMGLVFVTPEADLGHLALHLGRLGACRFMSEVIEFLT